MLFADIVTLVVPYIDLLVALWGALVVSQFLFMFPAVFHLCTISCSTPEDSYGTLGDWGRSSLLPTTSCPSSSSSIRWGFLSALGAGMLLVAVGALVCSLGTYCVLLAIGEESDQSLVTTHHASRLFQNMIFHWVFKVALLGMGHAETVQKIVTTNRWSKNERLIFRLFIKFINIIFTTHSIVHTIEHCQFKSIF